MKVCKPLIKVLLLLLWILYCFSETSEAEVFPVKTRVISYTHEGAVFKSYLALPSDGKRHPAVLLFPEWWGLNDFARAMAEKLAQKGFVVLAVDMYGDGRWAKTVQEAEKLSGVIKKNVSLMQKRAEAGLRALLRQPGVMKKGIAAVGFSLGGRVAVELAKTTDVIDSVVSVYGSLNTELFSDIHRSRASVLILHGSDDPLVDMDELQGIMMSLSAASQRWKVVIYGGAVHGFLNPAYGTDPSTGTAYNKAIAEDAFVELVTFLKNSTKQQ